MDFPISTLIGMLIPPVILVGVITLSLLFLRCLFFDNFCSK